MLINNNGVSFDCYAGPHDIIRHEPKVCWASKSANRGRSLYILYSESIQLLSGLGHVINKKTHNDENRDSLICI